jgi:hypothetical protein
LHNNFAAGDRHVYSFFLRSVSIGGRLGIRHSFWRLLAGIGLRGRHNRGLFGRLSKCI